MEYLEFTGKTVEDAITEALVNMGVTSDQIQYEVIDKGSSGFLGLGSKNAVIKVWKKFSVEESITDFLTQVTSAMGLTVKVEIKVEEDNTYNVELFGDDMGVLIGKRGQTLDSLQYLANLAVNKNTEEYVKIKLRCKK